MKLKKSSIEIKYGDPEDVYYIVSIDYMGDVTDIQMVGGP